MWDEQRKREHKTESKYEKENVLCVVATLSYTVERVRHEIVENHNEIRSRREPKKWHFKCLKAFEQEEPTD